MTSQSALNSDQMQAALAAEEGGFQKDLGRRQIQMIAIGGAIGTGLLMGAGKRMAEIGPALAILYLICGIFAFLILRAMGELVVYRPTSGGFVSYAREFMGERAAFLAGWLYFLDWAMTGIVDTTAVALYVKHWPVFADLPQWGIAALSIVLISAMNLTSVKLFGEMEFWFALIKAATISIFLLVALGILATGTQILGYTPGPQLIADHGGLMPGGWGATIGLVQGVVFAYGAIELICIAAGETKNARVEIPRAVTGVIYRIGLFYVGSVMLFCLLLPHEAYRAGESPFVTVFAALGVPYIGEVMNFVMLTAALSSLNSGLYSTGRILHSLACGGSAPKWFAAMSAQHVPQNGIIFTICIYVIGVYLNYLIPSEIFEDALTVATLGIISSWIFILLCHLKLRAAIAQGKIAPVGFRMPFAPWSNWASLGFLSIVIYLMIFESGQFAIFEYGLPVLTLLLIAGWIGLRKQHGQAL